MKFCKIGKGKQVHEIDREEYKQLFTKCCQFHIPSGHWVYAPGPATCRKCLAAAEREQKGKGK